MSSPEPVTSERAYKALKQGITSGARKPGSILNLQPLADELGISVSPVRDAIHRLVGQGLIDLQPGGGFSVSVLMPTELHQLYEWNDQVVRLAVRAPLPEQELIALSDMPFENPGELADAAAAFFAVAAASSRNQEFVRAVASTSERLSAARLAEPSCIKGMAEEIAKLITIARTSRVAAVRRAIREYHRRRLRRSSRIAAAILVP